MVFVSTYVFYLGCFQVLTITNKTVVNIGFCVDIRFLTPLGKYQGAQSLDHDTVILVL